MKILGVLLTLTAVLSAAAVRAEVPGMISFQGALTDEDGVALDTTVSIAFEIYTDSTGGGRLWGVSRTVTVEKGVFDVLLGAQSPIPDSVFAHPGRWLAVRVEDNPEMEPRQRIVSSAYAIHASQSDTAEYARSAPSANDGDWTISGSDIYSAVSGKVGIGRTTPSYKLDVQDGGWRQIRAIGTDPLAAGGINVLNDESDWAQFAIRGSGAASYPGDLVIGPYSQTEDLHLGHGNFYPKMTITPDGKTGIGITTPITMLDVRSPAAISDYFRGIHYGYDGDDGGAWISTWGSSIGAYAGGAYYHNAGNWTAKSTSASSVVLNAGHVIFNANTDLTDNDDFFPTERMRITNVGNVGIGTTSPGSKLEVAGLVHSTSDGFRFPDGSFQTSAAAGDGHSLDAADGSPADVVYVDADGEVGIGTTGPNSRLTIQAQSSTVSSGGRDESDFVARVKNTRNTDGYGGLLVDLSASPSSANDWPLDVRYDGTTKFVVRGDGNVGIGITSPSARLDVHHDQDALSTIGLYNTNISSSFDAGIQLVLGDNNGPPKLTLRQSGDGSLHHSYISHVDNSNSHLILENQNVLGCILLKTNSGTRMSIDQNGGVGIGTSSAGGQLQISHAGGNPADEAWELNSFNTVFHELNGSYGAENLLLFSNDVASGTDMAAIGAKFWGSTNVNGTLGFATAANGSLSVKMVVQPGGDVGIGTMNPLEKLEVAGTIHSTTGGFKFPDGTTQTSASGADGHSLDADDGSPTDAVYVDATGLVGIGTNTPSSKLDVVGSIWISDATGHFTMYDGSWSRSALSIEAANKLKLAGGFSTLYIPSDVGIGTSDPGRKLEVVGEAEFDGGLYARDATGIGLKDDAGNLGLWVEDGGNVGIGTSTPSAKLEINGHIRMADSSAQFIMYDGSGYRTALGVDASNRMKFAAGFSTLYIPNNVGIGTDSPAYKLDVNSSTGTAARFITTQNSSSAYGCFGMADPVVEVDGRGVYGICDPADYYGYGVHGDGGYMGVYGTCTHAATGHTAYGVYGSASGGTTNYGVYYSGGLGGSGSKSAIVRTEEGPRALYCQESPENWFEDFGSGEIRGGRAAVQLARDFFLTVTIDSKNPMKVFITPNADIGRWWVEKGSAGFVLMAPEAPEGANFDYRVVAKRRGYEDLRLEKVTAAYSDHFLYPHVNDVPLQYQDAWLKTAAVEAEKR
jgi:hypothetical protein